jgi:hypothetical protein
MFSKVDLAVDMRCGRLASIPRRADPARRTDESTDDAVLDWRPTLTSNLSP